MGDHGDKKKSLTKWDNPKKMQNRNVTNKRNFEAKRKFNKSEKIKRKKKQKNRLDSNEIIKANGQNERNKNLWRQTHTFIYCDHFFF